MSDALPDAVNYHRYLYRKLRPYLGRRVWEIGAGYGQYTAMLLADAREVLATDIDAGMLAGLEQRQSTAGTSLMTAPIDLLVEQTIVACAAWDPDSILCLNVLEHIEEDHRAIDWLHRHVRSGCRAVFLTPALPALYGFMDEEAGHFRRYTRHSLERVFGDAGWSVERSFYVNPVGALGWFVRNRVLPPAARDLNDPRVNADIHFFDRYLVPLTRALDPLFGSVLGQSVVVIARN